MREGERGGRGGREREREGVGEEGRRERDYAYVNTSSRNRSLVTFNGFE